MKTVEFEVSCFGYSLGGYGNLFELEIEESELEGMTEDEKEEYIHKQCWEYVMENLEVGTR